MHRQPHHICMHLLDASRHIILNCHNSDVFYCITSSAAHYYTCAASQASCRIRVHVTHFLEFSAGAFTSSVFNLHLSTFFSMVPQRILKHPNHNNMRWDAYECLLMRLDARPDFIHNSSHRILRHPIALLRIHSHHNA